MTHRLKTVLWVAVLVFLAPFVTADDSKGQVVTVAGMLVGTEENDDGDYTRVYLKDDNLGPLLVADSEKGKELVGKVGTQVEIRGRLVELDGPELGFTLIIHVDTWKPLKERRPGLDVDPD